MPYIATTPPRKVHYINVADKSPREVEELIQKLKAKFKRPKTPKFR